MTNKRRFINTMGMLVQPITPCMVHDQLCNDESYRWTRQHRDVFNMQLVLQTYQFNHSYDHAVTMIEFNPAKTHRRMYTNESIPHQPTIGQPI